MKIMARDQGLDSFPASAYEVKILRASNRLVRARSLPRFPTLSHDFPAFPRYPPRSSSAPDVKQSSGRASRVAEPEPHEHRTAALCFTLNGPLRDGGGTDMKHPADQAAFTPIRMSPACMIRTRAEEKLARKAGRTNKTWALNEGLQQAQPRSMGEIERRASRITRHESRNTAFPAFGTEALQSFFSAPACLA